ncbi:uncharacterized protein [Chelonus insularis]|uniref:uncharacterized protein n=1 Tax=Chelonus insularis TaxID=460826 RepID=UPI00158B9EE3|nr:uncharacterized protein LOC118069502 [Chelonus insularis]
MDNSRNHLLELMQMPNFWPMLIQSLTSLNSQQSNEQQPHCSTSNPIMNNIPPQMNGQTSVPPRKLTKKGQPFLKKLTNDQKVLLKYMYSRDKNFNKNRKLASKLGITEGQLQRWYQRKEKEEKQKNNVNNLDKRLVNLSEKITELTQNVENLQGTVEESDMSSEDDLD